jgi:ankyrin repeat protein
MKFGIQDLTDLSIFEELNTPNPNKSRHLKILREILDTNRYLETTDGRGRTPLIFAIVKKDIAAVKLILRYHPNLNKIAIIPGKTSTPLMEAATIQSFTITKLLVDAGADVYLRVPPDNKNVIDTVDDFLELTWIHHDMRNKLTRIKEYLLKANHSARVIQGNFRKYITKKKLDSANVIKRNYLHYSYKPGGPGYNRAKKHFESAFGVRRRRNNPALRYRNYDIFQEIDNPKTNDIWEIVEPTTHARRIRNYLARDRSLLEKTDGFGRTPLIAAVLSNDPVAVKVILAFHPDLNKIYRHFTFGPVTPLMAAAILENSENIRMLVNAGADISVRSNGRNAIDILNNLIEDLGNAGFNVNEIIKKRDYLLKANHSSHVIQGNYKKYLTKKKIGAANVIKKNYLNYAYTPGGPGYNRAKKHFESAFGKKRIDLKMLRSELKKVLK